MNAFALQPLLPRFCQRFCQRKSLLTSLWMLMLLLSFPPPSQAGVQLSLISTAENNGAIEGLVVEGGEWASIRHLRQQVVVIRHPQGLFLLDAGVGKATPKAFQQNSSLHRLLFGFRHHVPAVTQLVAQGIRPGDIRAILVSHLHWDHAGGLPDFPGVPVWVQAAELAAAEQGAPPSYLGEHRDAAISWHPYELALQPYEGFERSLDLLGDGTLVLVDLPGHTPGQSGLFVNAANGKRYFFSADTTWTQLGLDLQKSRPAVTRWLTGVDWNAALNADTIVRIAALRKRLPELIVLPAHDEVAARQLPAFPQFTDENPGLSESRN